MEYAKGPQGKRQSRPTTTTRGPLFQPRLTADPGLQRQRKLEAEVTRLTTRSPSLQRQVAGPVLRAAELHAQEGNRVEAPRAALQRQVNTLAAHLPEGAVELALQRQAERLAPVVAPVRPQSPGDWVTVMRAQAQSVQAQQDAGRGLDPRPSAQFTGLQRQVAQTLVQGYRQDRQASEVRSAQYAEHLLSLQRHPLSAPVARGVLGVLPSMERLSLQRAVNTAQEREQGQEEQDGAALRLHAVQRQLAELDAEATQPVFQRIQARRGAGNPLPTAIQRHLEGGLNHDLGRVRIHDDAEADVLAKGVNATAFTTGSDIFFRSGQFNPNTQSGLELLAHEVTHTVQQSQGRVGTGLDPDAGLETEARQMGAKLAQQRPAVQFGTRAKRPGENTVVRTPLQRAVQSDAPAIQRFGLGSLKKLARGGLDRVRAAAATIRREAARAVHRVKQSTTAVVRAAGQVRQAARARFDSMKRRAAAATARLAKRATAKFQSVRRRAGGVAERAKRSVTQRLTRLKRQVTAGTARLARTAKAKFNTVRQGARAHLTRAKQKMSAKLSGWKQKATDGLARGRRWAASTYDNLKKGAKAGLTAARKAARAKMDSARRRVGAFLERQKRSAIATFQSQRRRVRGALTKAARSGKALLKSRPATALALGAGALFTAYKGIQKGGVRGLWEAAKGKASAAWTWAKSPEGKAALARMAVTVGAGVGAAALTGLTGGLAAPLLIMAAGGAAGGALGRLTQNAVLKKYGDEKKYKDLKLTEGIKWKSALADGALGAAMGPAGALMGGVTRGVAGNLGRFALRPLGQSFARGLQGLGGARVAQVSARTGRVYGGAVQRPAFRQRLSATWKEMKAYNRRLGREIRDDVRQSIQGNAGVAGRARTQTRELFGGKRKLKAERFRIANDQVSRMNRLRLVAHARHLKLPTNLPADKLKTLVAQGLVKTNDRLIAQPIEQQALRLARKQVLRDAVQHLTGAPRRRGEGAAWHALRRVGSTFGMGVRANYRNLLDKDRAWADAIQKGQGFAYLGGAVTNESTKAAAVAYRTEVTKPEDQQKPLDVGKAVRDGTMNTFGVNPDLFSEKALPAALGVQQVATNLSGTYGAGAVSDNVQLEDAPEPEGGH